jgi:hypothetical protein
MIDETRPNGSDGRFDPTDAAARVSEARRQAQAARADLSHSLAIVSRSGSETVEIAWRRTKPIVLGLAAAIGVAALAVAIRALKTPPTPRLSIWPSRSTTPKSKTQESKTRALVAGLLAGAARRALPRIIEWVTTPDTTHSNTTHSNTTHSNTTHSNTAHSDTRFDPPATRALPSAPSASPEAPAAHAR